MKKITRQKVQALLKDVENNFSQLIDSLFYFESVNKDDWGWDIIHKIEELELSKEIELLIIDLENRNYKIPENLLYHSLWYSQSNVIENREILINIISKKPNFKQVLTYLTSLNKGKNKEYELNIQYIIDGINLKFQSLIP